VCVFEAAISHGTQKSVGGIAKRSKRIRMIAKVGTVLRRSLVFAQVAVVLSISQNVGDAFIVFFQ
jgi:hypothetical protein